MMRILAMAMDVVVLMDVLAVVLTAMTMVVGIAMIVVMTWSWLLTHLLPPVRSCERFRLRWHASQR